MASLRVTVVEAKDLPVKLNNSYVTVKLLKKAFKTKVCKNSINPQWNETFTFEITNLRNRTLEIYIENKGVLKPTPIGHIYVCIFQWFC